MFSNREDDTSRDAEGSAARNRKALLLASVLRAGVAFEP
jgi:hypothetical protein